MIYIFKFKRLFTEVGNFGILTKLMDINGTGVFVKHNNKEDLKISNIRRHLIGGQIFETWLQAPNPSSFREYFKWAHEGARVGKKCKAESIVEDYPILEVPDCHSILIDETDWHDDFYCDRTECTCVLNNMHWEGEDSHCPVKQTSDLLWSFKNHVPLGRYELALAELGMRRFGLKEERIDGLKFIRIIQDIDSLPLFEGAPSYA